MTCIHDGNADGRSFKRGKRKWRCGIRHIGSGGSGSERVLVPSQHSVMRVGVSRFEGEQGICHFISTLPGFPVLKV